jgi:hypothetical protein
MRRRKLSAGTIEHAFVLRRAESVDENCARCANFAEKSTGAVAIVEKKL